MDKQKMKLMGFVVSSTNVINALTLILDPRVVSKIYSRFLYFSYDEKIFETK